MMPIVDKAIDKLRISSNPYENIIADSLYWIPLQWLYTELLKNKDLIPISEIGKVEKDYYWRFVINMDAPVWKKINIAQAIYVYDFVK